MRWTSRQSLKDINFRYHPKISNPWANIFKEGSKHLQVEGVCDVPFSKRAREEKEERKSQNISKMKENVAKAQESQRAQKEYHERSSQDIKLPDLSRIFFKLVKFYYQYSFINCFHNIKFSFLLISRKLITSLKKVNRKQFGFKILILRSQSCLEVITSGKKKEYFHHFQLLWITQIFNILTIFSSYPDVKWELEVPYRCILTPSRDFSLSSFTLLKD